MDYLPYVILQAFLLAIVLYAVVMFFRIAHNVAAIRTMLENVGLFSGVPCPSCWMPVPEAARVCGHCGRDIEPDALGP